MFETLAGRIGLCCFHDDSISITVLKESFCLTWRSWIKPLWYFNALEVECLFLRRSFVRKLRDLEVEMVLMCARTQAETVDVILWLQVEYEGDCLLAGFEKYVNFLFVAFRGRAFLGQPSCHQVNTHAFIFRVKQSKNIAALSRTA